MIKVLNIALETSAFLLMFVALVAAFYGGFDVGAFALASAILAKMEASK